MEEDIEYNNGDKVYVGSRFAGIWIGNNPITGSEVVYCEDKNEHKEYHAWQVRPYPSVLVKTDFSELMSKL
jgi:hypothetical protein